MANHGDFNLNANIKKGLADKQLRKNLKSGMNGFVIKRKNLFSDKERLEQLRNCANSIKKRGLNKLPELLEQLEQNCTANGIKVHWAENSDQANELILNLMREHNATKLVKGKSMVSEEIELNHYLEKKGIDAMETDLGEFIIQLEGEKPSHIVVPAVHKNKAQIAKSFHERIPNTPYTEDVVELNAIARKTLRKKFHEGEVGLSGVNFAVAETGSLCLIENEGNGRMCTTVPPVHVALMGLEKVVEKLSDLPPLMNLLTGSATGQLITTYFNMITSPRKEGEKDGPKEVHLIILDNGRSNILADPELKQTLQCIRCGSCLNHCPVYTRIGGHAYGFTYPGPIGEILTPQLEGLNKVDGLPTASSLCNACEEICPAKIPIPILLRRLRDEMYNTDPSSKVKGHGYKKNTTEKLTWQGWAVFNNVKPINAAGVKMSGMFGSFLPKIGPLKDWTSVRAMPKFAKKSLHQMAKEEGLSNE